MNTIGFYVSPGFQMLDLAGPAGAFEAANDQLENPAYRLHVLAADKGAVTNSLGMATAAASLDDAVLDTLVVVGGPIDPPLSAGTLSRIVEASTPMPARCERLHGCIHPRGGWIIGRASSDDALAICSAPSARLPIHPG